MQNLKHIVPLKMKHFFIIAVRGRLMLLIQENVTWTAKPPRRRSDYNTGLKTVKVNVSICAIILKIYFL